MFGFLKKKKNAQTGNITGQQGSVQSAYTPPGVLLNPDFQPDQQQNFASGVQNGNTVQPTQVLPTTTAQFSGNSGQAYNQVNFDYPTFENNVIPNQNPQFLPPNQQNSGIQTVVQSQNVNTAANQDVNFGKPLPTEINSTANTKFVSSQPVQNSRIENSQIGQTRLAESAQFSQKYYTEQNDQSENTDFQTLNSSTNNFNFAENSIDSNFGQDNFSQQTSQYSENLPNAVVPQNTNPSNLQTQSNFTQKSVQNEITEKTQASKTPIKITPAATQSTNPLITEQDEETMLFLDTLVAAMLGYHLDEIPEDKREETINQCLSIFNEYILDYVKTKFGDKEAFRLRAAQSFGDPSVFTKFGQLGDEFGEAYSSFISALQNNSALAN